MDVNYWIYEDYFIFKPEFNGLIDDYKDIIKNYFKLIFSNYDNLEIPLNIKILTMDCNNFNLELNDLPSSIRVIKFDKNSNYNKELNNLSKL